MDEYIKREDALDAVLFALVGTGYQSRAIQAVRDVPTADVVPKSEVDEIVRQWKEEANCWQNNYITELRANEQIKAEVAREIFEEIEKIIQYSYYVDELGEWHDETLLLGGIYEIKKKYTEEKK